LAEGRIPAVIGGDHSTPYGLIQAVTEKYNGDLGILHIDAHADLRDAYQGYQHSHASIMHNVMEKVRPAKLVQVGIRDFSPGEYAYIQSNDRIKTYFDPLTKRRLNKGESWQKICDEAVAHLPKNVHISFDIDGLSPELCPGTGTPVPGGLSFDQALALFATVAESGRKIVSFDLNEVAEEENSISDWDGNVGARILFKLCGWTMVTNGFAKGMS
jgi:agmatinase